MLNCTAGAQLRAGANGLRAALYANRRVSTIAVLLAVLLAPTHSSAGLSVSGGLPQFSHSIEVPPGAGALQPKLALRYGGTGIDGPVALGWSISGTSIITRCAATLATDSARAGVSFNGNDKLCLDGQRLLPLDGLGNPIVGASTGDALGLASGAYREYRTEIDSYARIRAYGTADGSNPQSGPAFFKVWTKDNRVLEFGAGPSTASDPNTQAVIRAVYPSGAVQYAQAWALSRATDNFGNYIDFKYTQRDVASGSAGTVTYGHEANLAEIQYSGNKVVFSYSDRISGRSEAYQRIAKNVSVAQLDKITTYINSPNTGALGPGGNSVASKTTKLVYETGPTTGRLRLKFIQTCAGGPSSTKCMPAEQFGYSAGGGDAYQPSGAFNLASTTLYTTPPGPACCAQPFSATGSAVVDLNGDGKSDILRWSQDPTQNQVYLSNGDGTFTPWNTFNIKSDVLVDPSGCRQVIFRDFNGDGLIDIFRFANVAGAYIDSANNNCPDNGPSLLFLNNGDGTFARKIIAGVTPEFSWGQDTKWPQPPQGDAILNGLGRHFWLVDFDGDGLIDIVKTIRPAYTAPMYTAGAPHDDCSVTVCTTVYKGNGDGSFNQVSNVNVAHTSLYPVNAPTPVGGVVGDLDGDGVADLIVSGSSTAVSQRNGNFTTASRPEARYDIVLPLDYNGDGRSDWFLWGRPQAGLDFQLRVQDDLGKLPGSGVSNFNVGESFISLSPAPLYSKVIAGDFNGDGRDDLLVWGSQSLYLSRGDGTFAKSTTYVQPAGLGMVWDANQRVTSTFLVGDFSGKGFPEFLQIGPANALYVRTSTEKPDLLTSMTTDLGAVYTLSYFALSNTAAAGATLGVRYVSDRGTSWAASGNAIDLTAPPMYVVSSVASDSGTGTIASTEFAYVGLKVNRQGRGLLGFRKVLQQTTAPDGAPLTAETEYLQTFPYIGEPSHNKTFRGALNATASSIVLRDVQTIHCDQTAAAGADTAAIASGASCPSTAALHRPYALWSREIANDLLGNPLPTTTIQRSVTDSGEPKQVSTSTLAPGPAGGTYDEVVVNDYQADDTSCTDTLNCKWILGRPKTTTVQRSVPNTILPTSAGNGPYATATTGSGALQTATVSNVAFGARVVGSATQLKAMLSSTGVQPLSISMPAVTGADFSLVSTTCPASLPVGGTCDVTIQFAPTAATSRTGSLSINIGGGAASAILSGSGTAPQVTIVPGWTNWGSVGAGSDSGDWLTVRNDSTVPVLLTAHAPASNPTGTMWSYSTSTLGYCNFGNIVLSPGASCLTFFGIGAASAAGTFSAIDQIGYQAQGVSGATFTVQQGYSFSVANMASSPGTLQFGNVNYDSSSTISVPLTNSSDAALDSVSVILGGPNASKFVISSNTCSTSIPAHGTCSISVKFTPSGVANGLAGTLTITGAYSRYTSGGKQNYYPNTQSLSISLSGNGFGSVATLTSAASRVLAPVWYGSTAQKVATTFRNDGNAPLTLGNPTLTLPLSIWRATDNDCNIVTPGNSCTIWVTVEANVPGISQSQTFAPPGAAVAPAATTVTWTTNTAAPRWSPTSLNFNTVAANSSAAQNITLYNDGNTGYNWAANNGIANAPTGYGFNTGACSNVAPGGNCNVVVTFSPTQGITYSGSSISMSAASYNTNTFSVTGTGLAPPSASISPNPVSFGQVLADQQTTQTITVTNSGGFGMLSLGITGTGSSWFSIGSGGTCVLNTTMSGYSSCTIKIAMTGRLMCGTTVGSNPVSATATVTIGGASASTTLSGSNYRGKTGVGACG